MVVNHQLFADYVRLVPALMVFNVFGRFAVIFLLNMNYFFNATRQSV